MFKALSQDILSSVRCLSSRVSSDESARYCCCGGCQVLLTCAALDGCEVLIPESGSDEYFSKLEKLLCRSPPQLLLLLVGRRLGTGRGSRDSDDARGSFCGVGLRIGCVESVFACCCVWRLRSVMNAVGVVSRSAMLG